MGRVSKRILNVIVIMIIMKIAIYVLRCGMISVPNIKKSHILIIAGIGSIIN